MWNARPLLRMPGGSPPQAEGGCDMSHHRTTILVTNPRVISARRPLSSRSRFTTSTRGRPSGYASRSQEDKSNLPLTAYARRFPFRSRLGTRPCITCARHAEVRTCDVRLPWQSLAAVVCSIWDLPYPAHFSVHKSQTALAYRCRWDVCTAQQRRFKCKGKAANRGEPHRPRHGDGNYTGFTERKYV